MEIELWRIFASLGVPGLALGVLFLLFRRFKWRLSSVPAVWVGPVLVLFMLIVSGIVLSVLYLWAPSNGDRVPISGDVEVPPTGEGIQLRITAEGVKYSVVQSATDERTFTVNAGGHVEGIVSNPQASVFVLVRRLHRSAVLSSAAEYVPDPLWHVAEAVVKASGDWKGDICGYPHIEFDAPDYEYWEIMAVATYDRAKVVDLITRQVCAIEHSELLTMVSFLACSETRISMRAPISGGGYYIDPTLAPSPRQLCVAEGSKGPASARGQPNITSRWSGPARKRPTCSNRGRSPAAQHHVRPKSDESCSRSTLVPRGE